MNNLRQFSGTMFFTNSNENPRPALDNDRIANVKSLGIRYLAPE